MIGENDKIGAPPALSYTAWQLDVLILVGREVLVRQNCGLIIDPADHAITRMTTCLVS